jgi:hypothetical protein
MAHACNPSYSGGRDQEDRGSKPACANSSGDPFLKKTHHEKGAGGVAPGVGLEFKSQYCKKRDPPPQLIYTNKGVKKIK